MSTMLPRFLGLAITLSSAAGCLFVGTDPDEPVLCNEVGECPEGTVCNTYRHLCVDEEEPTSQPELVSAALSTERIATGVVELQLTTTAELDASTLVVTSPASAGVLPTGAISIAGTNAIVQYAFDAESEEGLYAFSGVTFADTFGNRAEAELALSFIVDKTAPTISNLSVAPAGDGEVFADTEGFDAFILRFSVDEPIVSVSGSIGGVLLQTLSKGEEPCVIVPGGQVQCTGSFLEHGLSEGNQGVVVEVEDAAGNASTATTTLSIDVEAPIVLDGSLNIAVAAPNGSAAQTLSPEGSLAVTFVVNEALGMPPEVWLDIGGAPLALDVAVNGLAAIATVTIGNSIAPGSYPLFARLTDEVGHVSGDLSLTAPGSPNGIVVADATLSACPAPPDLLCVDADGDGFFAASASCVTGSDCDDTETLVFPGAPELPGDGRTNDCGSSDGDLSILDAGGVFVDPVGGSASGMGTADDPVLTLAEALGLNDNNRWIFLASGTYLFSGVMEPLSGLRTVGGLNPADWSRTDNRSTINLEGPPLSFEADRQMILDHIAFDQNPGSNDINDGPGLDVLLHACTMVDDDIALGTIGDILVVRSNVERLSIYAAGAIRMVDTEVRFIQAEGPLTLVRSIILPKSGDSEAGLRADNSERIEIVSSIVDAPLTCNQCGAVTMAFSRMRVFGTSFTMPFNAEAQQVSLIGNGFATPGGAPFQPLQHPLGTTVRGNAFASESGCPFSPECTLPDYALDDDIASTYCAGGTSCEVTGNIQALGTQAPFDPLHELPGSDIIDAFSSDSTGLPPSVVLDLDGDCRFADGLPDIGADEVTN